MVLTVYLYTTSPPCRAVLITAKHLGIEVNTKLVDILKGEQLKPEYLKINPTHTVPTLDDDGFCLRESRAIQSYLTNQYAPDSNLYPKDPKKRAIIDRMLYFDSGILSPASHAYVQPIFMKKMSDVVAEENLKKVICMLDDFLSRLPYIAGDSVSLADLSILPTTTFLEILMDYSFSNFEHVSTWMLKLKTELPYYKEMLENIYVEAKQNLFNS